MRRLPRCCFPAMAGSAAARRATRVQRRHHAILRLHRQQRRLARRTRTLLQQDLAADKLVPAPLQHGAAQLEHRRICLEALSSQCSIEASQRTIRTVSTTSVPGAAPRCVPAVCAAALTSRDMSSVLSSTSSQGPWSSAGGVSSRSTRRHDASSGVDPWSVMPVAAVASARRSPSTRLCARVIRTW